MGKHSKRAIQKAKGKHASVFRRNWTLMLEVSFIVMFCVLHAASAGHYADFYPIDGTFQNFNPVRRLLSGQVPYRDFQDYLGLGHLYAGAVFTAIFGGSYRESIIAFSFLNFACLALISVLIAYAVLGTARRAAGMTCCVLLFILVKPLPFVNGIAIHSDILSALNSSLDPGISARFVRGLILPLSMFLLVEWLIRVKSAERLSASQWLMPACAGMVAGFCFPWSNDYGISCFVCVFVMIFFLSLFREGRVLFAIKASCIELAASVASLFAFAFIFTRGNVQGWFSGTFGAGGFQSWYYNSGKSFFIFNVDSSFLMLLQAFAVVAYLHLLWKEKASRESMLRYGIPCYANMVCFCAANEYKLIAGGPLRNVALAVLFFTAFYEGIAWICRLLEGKWFAMAKRGALLIIGIGCSAWIISNAMDEFVFRYASEKDGHTVAAMGGNLTSLYEDVIEASDFLQGEPFFSTYASAQEVVEGRFQPSGTDYIIHVLGDAQREKYLSAFREGNFRYAATIQKSYTAWEYWVERANWFFYRELYRDYHPVFANTYELYWERNGEDGEYTVTDPIEVTVHRENDATVRISVKTGDEVNGFADVFLDYEIEKRPESLLAKFAFQTQLRVENSGAQLASVSGYEMNYLRAKGAEYVPISVKDGYGEITLTALPSSCATLGLNDVKCDAIYTSYYAKPQ